MTTIRLYPVPGRVVFAPDTRRLRRLGYDVAGGRLPDGELVPAVRTNAGLQPQSALYRSALAAGDLSLSPQESDQ